MRGHSVCLQGSGRSFLARSDETILAAAARNSIWLPAACKAGRCGSCTAKLVSGEIVRRAGSFYDIEEPGDLVRLCVAIAHSDLVLDIDELSEPPAKPNRRFPATIVAIEANHGHRPNLLLRVPRAALSDLSNGRSIKIAAPTDLVTRLVIVSSDQDRVVRTEISVDPEEEADFGSIGEAIGAVVQIEVFT